MRTKKHWIYSICAIASAFVVGISPASSEAQFKDSPPDGFVDFQLPQSLSAPHWDTPAPGVFERTLSTGGKIRVALGHAGLKEDIKFVTGKLEALNAQAARKTRLSKAERDEFYNWQSALNGLQEVQKAISTKTASNPETGSICEGYLPYEIDAYHQFDIIGGTAIADSLISDFGPASPWYKQAYASATAKVDGTTVESNSSQDTLDAYEAGTASVHVEADSGNTSYSCELESMAYVYADCTHTFDNYASIFREDFCP